MSRYKPTLAQDPAEFCSSCLPAKRKIRKRVRKTKPGTHGIEEKVEASLEGVHVAKGEHLQLDSEGGAQVVAPKTRYLTTAISVMLATSSVGDGHERDHDGDFRHADASSGAANGASGF